MAKRTNNNQILIICGAVAIAVVVIIAIVLATIGNREPDASFFNSDETKYVINIDNYNDDEAAEYSPIKTHMVYYYSGDDVTDVKVYYEFEDQDKAQKAYEASKKAGEYDNTEKTEVTGRFIIITNKPSSFANLKASYIKQQIDIMESLESETPDDEGIVIIEDDTEPTEDSTDETTEEPTE